MNPTTAVKRIISNLNQKRPNLGASIHLSVPPTLSEFFCRAVRLQKLIEKFLSHVATISLPAKRICVTVRETKKMVDLEKFFSISPLYWLHIEVEIQAATGFESGTQEILEEFGYRCLEWIGVENSESQLGAFHLETQDSPALVLFVQNRGVLRNCDLLIPVN